MSVLFLAIGMAVATSIQDAVERHIERVKWARQAPRRTRRYTFN